MTDTIDKKIQESEPQKESEAKCVDADEVTWRMYHCRYKGQCDEKKQYQSITYCNHELMREERKRTSYNKR